MVGSNKGTNVNKAQHIVTIEHPYIFDFCDACHNIHNTCKDICAIKGFKDVVRFFCGCLSNGWIFCVFN
jgi:hypothetical protein